jgi:hypothetical protein
LELWKYTGEIVRIEFVDGEVMIGFVRDYTDQEDTENDYDELDFIPDGKEEITVIETEIKSIEVIS